MRVFFIIKLITHIDERKKKSIIYFKDIFLYCLATVFTLCSCRAYNFNQFFFRAIFLAKEMSFDYTTMLLHQSCLNKKAVCGPHEFCDPGASLCSSCQVVCEWRFRDFCAAYCKRMTIYI